MKTILSLLHLLLPVSAFAGAQLLGPLTDTIPPLPPPPPDLPKITQADIVSSVIHNLENRKVIIQEVTTTALPGLPAPPTPPPQPSRPPLPPELVKARLLEMRAKQRERQLKTPQLSAVVYHSKDFVGQVRTLFGLRKLPSEPGSGIEPTSSYADEFAHENQPLHEGNSIYFWSNLDANLLTQLPQWQANDGTLYEGLQLSINNIDLDQRIAAHASRGRSYPIPQIPALPVGDRNYQIVAGQPIAQEAAAIQAVHEIYVAEYAKLKAVYDAREQAKLEQAAYLKANPPKPKDAVIRYRLPESNQTPATK